MTVTASPHRSDPQLPSGVFRSAPHVVATEHAGTVMLFDQRTYFTLSNAVANRIWDQLRDSASAERIVSAIAAEYDVPRARIAADVAALLDRLVRERLIERVDGAGTTAARRDWPWWQFWRSRG